MSAPWHLPLADGTQQRGSVTVVMHCRDVSRCSDSGAVVLPNKLVLLVRPCTLRLSGAWLYHKILPNHRQSSMAGNSCESTSHGLRCIQLFHRRSQHAWLADCSCFAGTRETSPCASERRDARLSYLGAARVYLQNTPSNVCNSYRYHLVTSCS